MRKSHSDVTEPIGRYEFLIDIGIVTPLEQFSKANYYSIVDAVLMFADFCNFAGDVHSKSWIEKKIDIFSYNRLLIAKSSFF